MVTLETGIAYYLCAIMVVLGVLAFVGVSRQRAQKQ